MYSKGIKVKKKGKYSFKSLQEMLNQTVNARWSSFAKLGSITAVRANSTVTHVPILHLAVDRTVGHARATVVVSLL